MSKKLLLFISVIFLFFTLIITWEQPSPSISFVNSYAEVGTPFQVSVSGYSDETTFSYAWYVDNQLVAVNQDFYIPAEQDLEHFITVTVTASDNTAPITLSTYFSRLPVCYLTVQEDILKEDYVSGALKIQGNSLYSQEENLYSGSIQIRGRGNSTWEAYPKKPYKIKLEHESNLFDMGSNKHWVLLANYADESLLRDKIAYDLSGALGMPYMESTWVSVILNGEYIGNYLLCEQVRIDENRIEITNLTEYAKEVARAMVHANIFPKEKQDSLELTLEQNMEWLSTGIFSFEDKSYDITPYVELPELTGGFLLEIDAYFDEISKFFAQTQPVMFKDPEYACTNSDIMDYAENYFTAAFEAILESEDFYAIYEGNEVSYTELFDIHSLAQYVLIQEIFFNYDAALKSMYLYKDVSGPAYMGPIWDMDWSSGRTHSQYSIEQWWTVYYTETADETLWYSGLIKDPYFLSVMKEVWDSSYDSIMALIAENGTIEQAYEYIYESGIANSSVWPFEYGFTVSYDTFLGWMKERLTWLEPQFADLETLVNSIGQYEADTTIEISVSDSNIDVYSPSGSIAVLYYNGIRISEKYLDYGTASWYSDEYNRTADSDVIQIRIYDENKLLIGSNYIDQRN